MISQSLEHLQTLSDLVASNPLRPIPPYTLCRAAIENAAASIWVLSPQERQTRVLRRLHFAADDHRDSVKVQELGGLVPVPSLQERLARLADLGTRAGLTSSDVLGGTASWTSVVRAADGFLQNSEHEVEMLWRLSSGFAHGRPWANLSGLQRGEVAEVGGDVVHIEMTSSIKTLSLCVGVTLQLLEAALKLAERHGKQWTGSGPDVLVRP